MPSHGVHQFAATCAIDFLAVEDGRSIAVARGIPGEGEVVEPL